MNLRDLGYLVAVADERHFGRAADICNVGQPTLSTQIRKLEAELGVELLERNPRHVLLTDAGERVVERARIILREEINIRELAPRAIDPESGSVRLGLFPTLAPYLLPHVVPRVRKKFPKLELLLVEEKSEEILSRLRSGDLDAGLLALPIHDDQLHIEPLFEEEFLLAVPKSHPFAAMKGPVDAGILADESVLLLEDGHCLRDQALSVCHLAGGGEREGFRATSLETLRQMVAAGVGMTLLPNLSVQPPVSPSKDIVLLPFADPVPSRKIAMVWRRSTAFGDFLPLLAAQFRGLPAKLVHPLAAE